MTEYEAMRLGQCVQTMREACDSAEREIADCKELPTATVSAYVLHHLAWGLANASTGIESALGSCAREAELAKQTKGGAA